MTRAIHASNDLLTLFDLRAHNFSVDVGFSTYYQGHTPKFSSQKVTSGHFFKNFCYKFWLQNFLGKVKETEAITVKNADEEDKFEAKIARLQEEFKLSDTRAEFAERSVDKLEATIDGLLESLMAEKMNYRNISEKLDKTLNDMMSMT